MLDALSIQQIHCSGNIAHLFPDIILIPSILGFQRKLITFKSCFRNVELTFMHHLWRSVTFAFLNLYIMVLRELYILVSDAEP
jgi:hypothetical protein